MAKAFRCDRCKRYEDGEPVAGVTFLMPDPDNPGSRKNQANELCSPCLAELRDWLRALDHEQASA